MFRKEDFPALSDTSNQQKAAEEKDNSRQHLPTATTGVMSDGDDVFNVPPSMLADSYGIVGLLQCIRNMDGSSNIGNLAIGLDLTKIGLNLAFIDKTLYRQFGGPFSVHPLKMHERIDVEIPEEYKTNMQILDKLPQVKMADYAEDVLFYIFYNLTRELYQLAAANELYTREWRFHKGCNRWVTRAQYGGIKEQTASYEHGHFTIFDPQQWRKLHREMKIEYSDLEDRPRFPNSLQPTRDEREDIQRVQMLNPTLDNQQFPDPNNQLAHQLQLQQQAPQPPPPRLMQQSLRHPYQR